MTPVAGPEAREGVSALHDVPVQSTLAERRWGTLPQTCPSLAPHPAPHSHG